MARMLSKPSNTIGRMFEAAKIWACIAVVTVVFWVLKRFNIITY